MPTRYFDIPPGAEALAYGFNQFIDERRRLDEINRQKNLAKKAKRKRNLTMGLSAVGGAIALPLAAPALGLAGAAGSTLAAGGTALPGVGATAGIFGAGGALTGAGTLAAGLTGAGIGANVGGYLSEGDLGGAIGAAAGPLGGMYANQRGREIRDQERASDRAANLSDAIMLDEVRTKGNIKQIQAEHDYKQFGMPRAEWDATAQAAADYASTLGSGPQMGEDLGLDPAMATPAMGPFAGPGPSEIPGMEYQWTRQNYAALSKLERQRLDTVDNPQWRASATPERLASETAALQRARSAIRPSLVPTQPKPMTIGEDGKPVPMQIGWNKAPDGGWSYLSPDGKQQHVAQPKGETDPQTPWVSAPTPQAADAMKAADFKAKTHIDEKGRTWKYDPKQRDWELQKDGDGVDGTKKSPYIAEAAAKLRDARGPVEKARPVDPVKAHKQEVATAFRLEIADMNPETITLDEYLELNDRLLRTYGTREKLAEMFPDLDAELWVLAKNLRPAATPGNFGE